MLAHPRGDVWKQSDTQDRVWVLTCGFEIINKKIKDHILSQQFTEIVERPGNYVILRL